MANEVITQTGLPVLGTGGLGQLTAVEAAPNGVNLSETVDILTEGAVRQVYITLPSADYSSYTSATLVWRARDGGGAAIADVWTFALASGTTLLGPADVPANGIPAVLGVCAGTNPRYELCVSNASGMGYSRGILSVASSLIALNVSDNPTLDAPTEGMPLTGLAPVYTGEEDVTYSWSYQVGEDASGTGAVTSDNGGICPEIDGSLSFIRRGALFADGGSGSTTGLEGPYWSDWVEITAASVSTPVTETRATIIASNKVVVESLTGAAPLAGTTLTSGSATATIVAYVASSSTAGTIYTGAITSGPIADNAALSWTGGSGLANGGQAAWQLTAGEPFYILPAAFSGDVTSNDLIQEIANDSIGTGAVPVDLNGSFPAHYGTKYYCYTRRVSGYGIANPPGYEDFSTAWTAIGIPTLAKLADVEWPVIGVSSVTDGTKLDYVLVKASLNASAAWWTTRSDAQIVASPFPDGHELMTLDGTLSLTITTIAVDGMTGSAPANGTVITSGASTATVYAFVVGGTSGTGTIYASALSSGTIADNAAITWAGGAGLANGAASAAAVSHQKWLVNPTTGGSRDFSIFLNTTDEDTRRTLFAVTVEIGGARTPLSNRKTVPTAAALTSSDRARYINRSQLQGEQGVVGGCGMQFGRATAVDGDYAFVSFDVTGPCETFDFGDNWQVEPNVGLKASQSTTGAVAFDSKYVVAIFGNLFMARANNGDHADWEGIWRKNRATGVWSFVKQITGGVYGSNDTVRFNHQHIAVQRGSGSTSENRVLWALAVPSETGTFTTIQVLKSTDSGGTWANDGGTISVGTYGYPINLVADGSALYMATKANVFRRPIGSTTWTAATGLPSGNKVHLEKHGSTVYVSVQNVGLYTATDATTLSFTQKKAFAYAWEFAVCPTNTGRIIITGRDGNQAQAINQSIYTGDNGANWTATPNQQFPDQYNDFAHKLAGEATWLRWHDNDASKVLAMRNQHNGKSTSWPPSFGWASNNQDYSEFRSFGYDYDDYRRLFGGMTDRLFTASDHGAAFVVDDAVSNSDKTTIKSALSYSGALTARGCLILTRGARTGYVGQVGGNQKAKIPVVLGRDVTTTRTDQTATGNGAISVTASSDLPSGKYTLTCTTAASNGGTFTGFAPMGVAMGTWTVGAAKTYTDPRGGTLQVTISDGSVDFKAGSNPCVFTIEVNPIGGARTIFTGATTTPGYFSQTNPATHYRGGSGRHVFEMDTGGTITILRTLSYEFLGYAGTGGSIILGYSANGSTIWRSTNEGVSWTQMASGLGIVNGKGNPVLYASNHSDTRCYAGLNNGKALRVDGATKTTVFDLDAWCTLNGVTPSWPGSALVNGRYMPMISGIVESNYDPNLVYLCTYMYGAPYTFFRTKNALDATPVWENITYDAASRGLVQPIQFLSIHPVTDEVFMFSAHGTVMHRPEQSHRTTYGITASLVDDLRAMPGGDYTSVQPI